MRKFKKDEWGHSDSITFNGKNDRIFLGIDVVGGQIQITIGDISIDYDELEEFIEHLKRIPTLLDSIKVHVPSSDGRPVSPIIAAEMERISAAIPSIFDRNDTFFRKLKKL